ncbi:O-antigen ligase [Micromonospora coriariae]|uniref:O-antigen ligase n=2 Tax=Micromonospora coriariae TaxID=285665 RepID=A0A1C4UGH1_9ACTN|nr:O-antigen ligase [Micromonospora coriariae]
MMTRGDTWSPVIGSAVRASRTTESGVMSKQRGGIWSTAIRAAVIVFLLNFDQFPRTVGRAFLITGAVLAVLVVLHDLFRPASRARVVVFWVLLMFGVLALPGILRRPETEYGQQKFFLLLTLTLLATISVAIIRGRRDVEMFAAIFLGCGVVLALAALVGEPQGDRSGGFGSNPIWLARAIGGAMVALAWLYFRSRLSGWWAAGIGLLLILGLFATGSRGPLVATAAAVLTLVLAGLRQKGRRRRREWVGVGLMSSVVAAVWALPSLLPPRMYALIVDPSEELFDSARADMRQRTLSVIAENPGGVGYGNWNSHTWMIEHTYPHNLWLELTAEGGWLVGGLFMLAVAVVAIGLWRSAGTDPVAGFVLATLTFNVLAVSTSGDINASRPLFCSLALGLLVLIGATRDEGAGRHRMLGDAYRHGPPSWQGVDGRWRAPDRHLASTRRGVPPVSGRREPSRPRVGHGRAGECARR